MNKRKLLSAMALSAMILPAGWISAQSSGRDMLYYSKVDEEQARQDAKNSADVDEAEAVLFSSSKIDWSRGTFSSNVSMDIVKAGIPMPSGKNAAVNKIKMELPVLIKDPLLSIYVDDTRTLSDMVLDGSLTLEELTRIIDNAKETPAYFKNGGDRLLTEHTIRLEDIGSLFVKHRSPYTQQKPIARIASRAYTGIVIDARGKLPVHGEFVESLVDPCLFPKVYDSNMTLVYERNMVDPKIASKQGINAYCTDIHDRDFEKRVGDDPLWITAEQVFGVYRCDPVISSEDYLRIATVPANLKLLQEGKIVILLGKEQITHRVSAPDKSTSYYVELQKLRYVFEDKVPNTVVKDGPGGIQITVQDLNFIADSAELLPADKERVGMIAAQIKEVVASGNYSIKVEGHTADVNKPAGQLQLSIDRANTIVDVLTAIGIDKGLISARGYGGTKPIADNATSEGRAANRRVEITIMPADSYVQKR
ncbi:MAG: OmpA family protein [Treponema sp.]|nr:OmpA family protein [Treponema sp.]MCR5620686.1 OmpA family protein [Treponema sp.]